MSKADFLRNNRGINDGGDLPQARALRTLWLAHMRRFAVPARAPLLCPSTLRPLARQPPNHPSAAALLTPLQDFMEALYDRIVTNEIKMKDESLLGGADAAKAAAAASAGWLDTIMNLLPGRAKAASAEPNDEAIRRTHDYLRWAQRWAALDNSSACHHILPSCERRRGGPGAGDPSHS